MRPMHWLCYYSGWKEKKRKSNINYFVSIMLVMQLQSHVNALIMSGFQTGPMEDCTYSTPSTTAQGMAG